MDPRQSDYFYPHSRETLFYKHGKPLFLLKAALMPHIDHSEEAEYFDASEE